MAVDETKICNLALARIGLYQISSMTSPSTEEERLCSLHYDTTRDAVLSEHAWDFAHKRRTLALLTDEYTGYEYAYSYPSDCLVAREIYTSGTTPIVFEVIAAEDLQSKVIVTDEEDAELIYTARITDTNLFTPVFITAFSLALASKLCQPLKGDRALYKEILTEYLQVLSVAKRIDATEGHVESSTKCDFIDVRA